LIENSVLASELEIIEWPQQPLDNAIDIWTKLTNHPLFQDTSGAAIFYAWGLQKKMDPFGEFMTVSS
jgi:hypothetical protein